MMGRICGTTGAAPCYSTVPIFGIDENNMTSQVLWRDDLSPVYVCFPGQHAGP